MSINEEPVASTSGMRTGVMAYRVRFKNTVTNCLLNGNQNGSCDTISPLINDRTPKASRFDMGELRSDLEGDGEYARKEIDVIIYEYRNRHRSNHHKNFKTLVNRVLGLNDNVIGEIRVKRTVKILSYSFRFNIGFGKCFICVKTIVQVLPCVDAQ